MSETTQPVGKLTPVSSGTKPVTAPVGKLKPVGEVVVTTPGFDPLKLTPQEEKMKAVGEVVDSLEFSEGYNKDEKDYLINLAQNPNIDYDTWNNAKLTVGGNQPIQGGIQKYYIDDKTNLPVPLAYGQRPPKGKEIESIWGSQASAEDDSILTTIGKNLATTIPALIESVGSVANLAYGLASGNDAEWYQETRNRMDALTPKTSEASKQSMFEFADVNNMNIYDTANWNFTPDNIAGNLSSLASTVAQFLAGGEVAKGLGLGSKAIAAVAGAEETGAVIGAGTKALAQSPYFVGSFTTNLGTVMDSAEEAGIQGRDKFVIGATITPIISMLDMKFGLMPKLINNTVAQEEKKAMIKALVKGWKDSGGEMTAKSLDELYKTATVGATASMSKIAQDVAKTGLGEATEEVAQNFAQRGIEQIYDNMYAENKKVGEGRYGKEIANAEALGDYINDFIGGAIGGGALGGGVGNYRRAKAEAQSENVYEYLKKGDAGVVALKAQLGTALKNGSISSIEYDLGVHKVDTYAKYYDQTADLGLDDKSNRRVFDLTWSNENLKQQQELLMENPESKIKGTIPHRRLLDTEALLEANSKEMSALMATEIADQQTAIATSSEEKLKEINKEIKHPEVKKMEAKPETKQSGLINQIKEAETEKDLDAFMKQSDAEGLTTPEIIDEVGKRRQAILNPPVVKPVVVAEVKPEHKELHQAISETLGDELDFNNLRDVKNRTKADIIVNLLDKKGERMLGGGELEIGAWAKKVANKKQLPLYYVVDFGGKKVKMASSEFTKGIKEKDFTGRKVDVQLVKPTDENLAELVKEGILEPHEVVERTDENGVKSKFFVFNEDDNKVRYPYVLAVRLKTKSGNPGVTIGNLAINDKQDGTLIMAKKKPASEGVSPIKENIGSEKKTIGEKPFDRESAEVDYEAQLESAKTVTIEEEDEGFTATQEADAKKLTKEEFVNKQIDEQIADGDFEAGSDLEKTSRKLWAKKYDKLNNIFSAKDSRNIDTTQEGEEKTSDEVKPSENKLDDEDFNITPYTGEPPVFQKEKGELTTDSKEARAKKIALLKKAIPGIEVVEDATIGDDVAGQLDADGKTIRLNPNYNYSDTPIHEFGHALIDVLGGTKNSLIRKGIEQLKGTKLWDEIKERYLELNDDMLAKEVLAEAIGREGVDVFDTKEKQSKFKNWLDGIFYKIKRLLGIEKNVAKNLASQLLSGKRIVSRAPAVGETQKQKNKEEKTITSSKPISFNKWKKQQNIDELQIKERIADLKEEIIDASGEQKNILEGELEFLQQSIDSAKENYENYVADHKSIIDFIESKGDVSKLSLDELYEIQSQMIKYDDIVKTQLYKDLLYNIGAKLNEMQTAELKAVDPNYNPEVEQKGDLKKQDIWAQGLSTIGEKFPAIQAFYKRYRSASGEMNKELSAIQVKGKALAEKVIKEYHKKHGIAERLKNFTIGGGSKYFSFLAKDGQLIEKGSKEYNKLTLAQKELLDFITTEKASLDKYMESNVLLKSSAGFIETLGKSGLYKAYANHITNNHNLRNVKVVFKHPETGKVTEEYYGDVEAILNEYGKKSHPSKIQAMALLTKYNLKARAGLGTTKQGRGKYFLRPDGKLVSMFGGEFKGDFTENYYETFMKYAQDAVFSKNMSPLMPTLSGVEMFYKAMGSDKENVSKFLEVVRKGKFLGETKGSPLGETGDAILRTLRKWTSWRFIAFNLPANIFNVLVGEYNQLRAEGGKSWIKGKKRMASSLIKGKKNSKAMNILRNYYPDLVTDINRVDPEKHIGRYFDMFAFGGQKVGEAIIRGGAVLGKLSTEHYNWFDNQGKIKGTPEQVKEREAIIKKEIAKYISQVERVQGRYSDVEKRNFAYFELGQFMGQFKVWMPEWFSDRFANTYIDADGVKRQGSFRTLFNYGMRDFMRNATKKEFYTSDKPKDVAMRKQLRGMIITAGLYLAYLSASDDDEDKDMAHQLDKMIKNVSGIYNMDNNTFLLSQPASAMSTVVDLAKTLKYAINMDIVKSGKNKGNLKALDMGYNLLPANKLISAPIDLLSK